MTRKKRTRVTKIEKDKRVQVVQEWIIKGHQDNRIIRDIVKKWDISSRQAHRYLKDAYDSWKPDQERSIEVDRAAAIARLQKIALDMERKHAKTPKGVNSLLAVERQIHRLKNLMPARQVHVEVKEVHEMTPEEREKRLQELLKKLGIEK